MWSSIVLSFKLQRLQPPSFCDSLRSPQDRNRLSCPVRLVNFYSDGGAPSIHGEFCAVNEAGTVCRQEDNCFCNFLGCCRTPRGGLGQQAVRDPRPSHPYPPCA